jgi:haloalkane dehalogenase
MPWGSAQSDSIRNRGFLRRWLSCLPPKTCQQVDGLGAGGARLPGKSDLAGRYFENHNLLHLRPGTALQWKPRIRDRQLLKKDTHSRHAAWRELYPFTPNFLQLGDVRMHYVDEGDGPPVLMVHGNPTWSFYYRQLIETLRPQFRTIAVDHVGCGLSDKPLQYDYQLRQHIENLLNLIDACGLSKATLIAHDWGGAIGLGALLRRPDVFERVVLLNTGAFPPPYIPFRIRVCRWPIIGKFGVHGLNLFARAATLMATEQPGGLAEGVAAGLLAPYDSWNNRTAIYQFVRDIPGSPSHPTWSLLQEIENGLDSLRRWPIQLIWGMKDWCFRPQCLKRFVEHWPDAEIVRIEDAGHYVLEDAPVQVSESVVDFLRRTG